MSFATDVRGELARLPVSDVCCARSELTAALLTSGGIAWRGRERYGISITAADAPTVRRFYAAIKRFWGITGQIRTLSGDALNAQTRYQLTISEQEALVLLKALDLLDESALFGIRPLPPEETVGFACCKKSFIRGAFLMCGAVTHPDREYHLEIAAPSEALAQFVTAQALYFDIHVKTTCRKSKYVIYLKRAEDIADMLTLLGASQAMMAFENVRIKKELSNRVNRQMNFDQSNINRVVDASSSQIEDILYIDRELGLDKLPRTLRDMAIARANNPETSLAGLGELLDPPIGKSGVNARLRRITDIAQKLRTGEEIIFKR